MESFAGRKVLITGGSSGIGKEIARQFLELGARVAILADLADKLEGARRELAAGGRPVSAILCDLADAGDVRRAGAEYLSAHGAPDILVNNAGYAIYRTFEELEADEIDRLLRVNFVGACLITRAVLPAMIENGGGHIVMMSSIAGRLPMTPCGVYSAAKHGMVAWAETLRAEVHRHGIEVHTICPGRVETAFFDHETFVQRAPRREAQGSVPVATVARATIDAVRRGALFSYQPRWYRWMVWLAHSAPVLSRPALQRLMRQRVASLAISPAASGSNRR
jgi:uncharacterized protein